MFASSSSIRSFLIQCVSHPGMASQFLDCNCLKQEQFITLMSIKCELPGIKTQAPIRFEVVLKYIFSLLKLRPFLHACICGALEVRFVVLVKL